MEWSGQERMVVEAGQHVCFHAGRGGGGQLLTVLGP